MEERVAKLRAMCAAEAEAIKRAAAALQDVGSQIEIRDRNNIESRRMQEHLQRENALLERQNMDLMRSHGACAKALCTSDPPEQTPAMGLAWLLLPFFPTNGIPQAAVEVEDVMLEHKRKCVTFKHVCISAAAFSATPPILGWLCSYSTHMM